MSGFEVTGNLGSSFGNVTGSLSSEKLGVTTTVKEQVENIETAVEHFKRCIDQQRKIQSELESQLRKLNQKAHKDFNDMFRQTSARAAQLIDVFRHQNDKQTKQFEFMDLQTSTTQQQHKKMRSISSEIGSRTGEMQAKVGV